MGRYYTELQSCGYHFNGPPDGELGEYLDKHEMIAGYCKICHREDYELEKRRAEGE